MLWLYKFFKRKLSKNNVAECAGRNIGIEYSGDDFGGGPDERGR